MPRIKLTEQSFWERVDIKGKDECWNWKNGKMKSGYGEINSRGNVLYTHRLAYEYSFGEIPQGLYVLHTCDNRACCNPHHLFVGTHKDNMKDCSVKDRSGSAKLSNEKAIKIRKLYEQGERQIDLAKQFNVSQEAISYVITRRNHKYAEEKYG